MLLEQYEHFKNQTNNYFPLRKIDYNLNFTEKNLFLKGKNISKLLRYTNFSKIISEVKVYYISISRCDKIVQLSIS